MKSFQLYLSIESKTPILYVNINFTGSLLLRFGVFPFFWALAPTNNVFSIVSWRSPAANNWRNKRPNGHILIDSPSIRRRNSTWKVRRNYINLERRIYVEITTSTRHGSFDVDSTFKINETSMGSPRRFFDVVSTSNRHKFCTRCFHCIIS